MRKGSMVARIDTVVMNKQKKKETFSFFYTRFPTVRDFFVNILYTHNGHK